MAKIRDEYLEKIEQKCNRVYTCMNSAKLTPFSPLNVIAWQFGNMATASKQILKGSIDYDVLASKTDSFLDKVIECLESMAHVESNVNTKKRIRTQQTPSPSSSNSSTQYAAEDVEMPKVTSLEDIKEQLDRIEAIVKEPKKSYASVLKDELPLKSSCVTLVVSKSLDDNPISGNQIKEEVRNLKSIQENVGVSSKYAEKAAVLVVRNKEEADTLSAELINNGFNVKEKSRKVPQIKIAGHSLSNVQNEDFLKHVASKNPSSGIDDTSCEVVSTVKKTRSDGLYVTTVKVTEEVARRFRKGLRLYVGDRRCAAFLDDQVVQCYHCRAFGHTQKYCRVKEKEVQAGRALHSMCPKCGEKHEKKLNCLANSKCSNCTAENVRIMKMGKDNFIPTNHSSNDFKMCPVAKRYKAASIRMVEGPE